MKHRRLSILIISSLIALSTSFSLAQDVQEKSASSVSKAAAVTQTPSAAQKPADSKAVAVRQSNQSAASLKISSTQKLKTKQALESTQAPGTCPVINGLMTDYCQQQPDDIYCLSLQ